MLKCSITLFNAANDPILNCISHSYLASLLYEEGKQDEARAILRHALSTARCMRVGPCVGFALVALAHIRLMQVNILDNSKEQFASASRQRTQLLERAKHTLKRVITLKDIEAETKVEGYVALVQVLFLLGEHERSKEALQLTQEKTQQFELAWLAPRIQRLWGNILEAQCHYEQAHEHFERSLEMAEKYHMRLEAARTMLDYGKALLLDGSFQEAKYQQGLRYLHEARQRFIKCNAMLDLQSVEHFLASREELRTHEVLT